MTERNERDADVFGFCCLRFPVSDLKASVDFYCDVLAFEVTSADFAFGEAHVSLKGGNGPSIFLMQTAPEHVRPLKFVFPRSFFITNSDGEVTVIELWTNDVRALHERVTKSGVQSGEISTKDEFSYFTFLDPDGHYIRAVEERTR